MLKDFNLLTAIGIFFLYFIIDILSSWFIIALGKLQRWTTTALTFCLYMGTAVGIFEYTHNFSYSLFMALGASLGNFVLVTEEKHRQRKEKNNQ